MALRRLYGDALDDDYSILKARVTEIADTFLRDISFQMPDQQNCNLEIEENVLRRLRSDNFPTDFIQRV
jgi:hypothetical protein